MIIFTRILEINARSHYFESINHWILDNISWVILLFI